MIDRKTGEKTRSRFKTLTLKELSAVDNPAQEGARFTIMKRADDDHKDDATKALYDFNEIADIVREMHKQTPDIVSKLDALIKAGSSGDDEKDMQMTDAEKIADLEKKVADLTAERDTIKADVEKKDGEIVILKSAATEEILKVGETEVRKSVVGEAQFAIFKAQQAEIVKAREEASTAKLEKRADDEFGHVPGTATEKALVLKAVSDMPEAVRKSFETIMTAAENMAKSAFDRIGMTQEQKMDVAKAAGDFQSKVNEIAKRDNIQAHQAMSKARQEAPELYARAYPQAN